MALVRIDWKPSRRTLRSFGVIALLVFAAAGALVYGRLGPGRAVPVGAAVPTAYVLWAVAAYCGFGAAVLPAAIRPIYLLLSVAAFPIGLVVAHAAMALLFYGVVTPIGLILRLAGRDPMVRRFDADAPSYWIQRRSPAAVERYFRQF